MRNYRKVRPGDDLEFPAPLYNQLVEDAAQRDRRPPVGGPVPLGGVLVRVRNGGEDPLPRFAVIGVEQSVITPTSNLAGFQQDIKLVARAPSLPDDSGRFLIVPEMIKPGEYGLAIAIGTTQAQVNVVDAAHTFADAADGDVDKLTSSEDAGAQILWKPSGTGLKWAIVRLGGGGGGGESAGQYDGMVKQVTAQLTTGYAYLRLVNRPT